MPGYRAEPQVNPKSGTETYVALKLAIDNWRWAGVPIYLRTGKRMAKRVTEIAIKFKAPPALLFRQTGVKHLEQNELVLHIQPDEGISLSFSAKIPGPVVKLGGVDMNFKYADYFGSAPSTGYETLLLDCMLGDPALFQRADTVDAGWRVVDPILDAWKQTPAADFPNYAAGSAGPSAADESAQTRRPQMERHLRMISLREVLMRAEADKVAVGHFNFSDLVSFNAIVAAARDRKLPVMVGVSEGEREFTGVAQAAALVKAVRDEYGYPIFLNADHTHSIAHAETAAKSGLRRNHLRRLGALLRRKHQADEKSDRGDQIDQPRRSWSRARSDGSARRRP